MKRARTVILDLTPEGEFVSPPRGPERLPWPMRLALAGAVVAVLLGVIAFAAFAFWLAVTLLPVVILAGLIAYGALRFQLWRDRR